MIIDCFRILGYKKKNNINLKETMMQIEENLELINNNY